MAPRGGGASLHVCEFVDGGKKQLLGFWLARTFTQCDTGCSGCGSDASLGLRLRVGGSARFDRGGGA
jgi:hypothetical protein